MQKINAYLISFFPKFIHFYIALITRFDIHLCTILMLILGFFTLLLYKCSHQSVKLGYYQLRFVVGNLVVYDAITNSTAWKWDISHICGYSFEKASAVRIEIGRYIHVSKHNVFIHSIRCTYYNIAQCCLGIIK